MASKKQKKTTPTPARTAKKREHRHTFMLNEDEEKAFERYLKKYRISNRSGLIRKTLMSHIIQRLEEDYPTLF